LNELSEGLRLSHHLLKRLRIICQDGRDDTGDSAHNDPSLIFASGINIASE